MGIFKNIFFVITAILFMFSCGLPTYSYMEAPSVESTDDEYSLAFAPTTDTNYYILGYKLYWESESSLRSSDENTIEDDGVKTGFSTLEELDFVQMRNSSDKDSTGNYPNDSTDITLIWDGSGTITLTFDTSTGKLSASNANYDTLFRRTREVDSDGKTTDSDIEGFNFLSAEYDYQDSDGYTVDSTYILGDGDDIHSDVYDIFDDDRFYGDSYDGQSIYIAVAVYSYGMSNWAEIEESVPVHLGYVSINPLYWDPNF